MGVRRVKQSKKNSEGDILALCNAGESWAPRYKQDAIRDIENRVHSYYVVVGSKIVEIKVVEGGKGKYLRTDPDKTTKNNLFDLPDVNGE